MYKDSKYAKSINTNLKIQVNVSTMNQVNTAILASAMNINNYVIINQITEGIVTPKDVNGQYNSVLSFNERGLSRSRNRAILASSSDICVIADDDMYYVNDYEKLIEASYAKYIDADIIAFYVDNENPEKKKRQQKEGQIKLLKSMKLSSVQISFKRKSIFNNNIIFDERFGPGTVNYMGEENIFLADCLRNNLKIYYVPTKIATLKKDTSSTWFRGYNKQYLTVKGMVFYRMSAILSVPFVLQFAIRKRKLYKSEMSMILAIRYMMSGLIRQAKNEK